MNRSKTSANTDTKITMLAINEKIIKEIKEKYSKKPQKEELLSEYKRKYKASKNTGDYITTHDLFKKIQTLKQEIKDIEDQTELSSYYINSDNYLKDYKNVGIKDKDKDKESIQDLKDSKEYIHTSAPVQGKGTISSKYIQECLGSVYQKDIDVKLICQECNNARIINHKEAQAICNECGSIIMYQDNDVCNEFSEEIEVLTQFAYKPINHFKEWISKLLARESSNIPEHVINSIYEELKKDRITKAEDVTKTRIKRYLKTLGYNKLYEDIPAILYKICHKEPQKISKELEAKLINMFEQIQEPYAKYKPANRINFLSYSYVIYKFAEILGEHELMAELSQLKSREKLQEQDVIMKKITTELGWNFIPST